MKTQQAGRWPAIIFFLAVAPHAMAAPPPDPLRFIPEQADFLVGVTQPRALIESVLALDSLKDLRKIEPVRELYESTNVRRFQQLVAYYEKQLGAPWPQLLDRLA